MKKIIFAAVAVMAFTFSNAQNARFGIKGGLNFANFTGDTEGLDFKTKVGFNIGGFVEVKLADKFYIQPELLYSTQGSIVDDVEVYDGFDVYYGDVQFKFNYINVPVMFKYYVADKFNLEAGPQIGFLVSAEATVKVEGTKATESVKDNFETLDFGLNFGAGYDFTKNFSAGVRYNLGLANIADTEPGDDGKVHNSVFSLSVGYKF
jgi:hypothetical protein